MLPKLFDECREVLTTHKGPYARTAIYTGYFFCNMWQPLQDSTSWSDRNNVYLVVCWHKFTKKGEMVTSNQPLRIAWEYIMTEAAVYMWMCTRLEKYNRFTKWKRHPSWEVKQLLYIFISAKLSHDLQKICGPTVFSFECRIGSKTKALHRISY